MLVLAVLSVPVLLLLRIALWRPLAVQGEPPADGYVRVAGVVHVHTTRSDGGGRPEEVVNAAAAGGLGFIAITDHNNLDAKPIAGYHGQTLVIVGTELSTTAGHLLGLGIPDPIFRFSGDVDDGLQDVRDLGGVAFAAHPLSPRDDLRFTAWDRPGSWGLELMNGDSEWRGAGARVLLTAGLYGVNQRYALLQSLSPPAKTVARWDELLRRRDVSGIVGADAHSRLPIRGSWALRFPGYEALFELTRNHVLLDRPLTGDAAADERAIVAAVGQGRLYVGLDGLAAADEFSFTAEGGPVPATMGDSVPLERGLRLRARGRMPEGTTLTLWRDGRPLQRADGALDVGVPGAGVFRVEAHVPGWDLPWIVTNPIYVFDEATLAQRREAAAWPVATPPPPAAIVLDEFEGRTILLPEKDASSEVEPGIADPHGGPDGRTAARLAFRLGTPGPGRPFTWCALVNRQDRDLSGRQGLVFSIRGDGVFRVWVQVRDHNPASADDGTEWWFASVKTETEWRRVGVPFARLRSINPNSDGKLDLDQVRQLVFVIDPAAVKAGSAGKIWISGLGVY